MPPLAEVDSQRLVRHLRKKVRTIVHGLRPSGVYGRFAAPAVLLNSIPKAGTHLLETALERYPLLRNAGKRTVSCAGPTVSAPVLRAIGGIGRGAFLNAHVVAAPPLLEVVQQRGIRVLLMIRDPRDIVVSHFKYVGGIDKTHRLYEHYRNLPDDEARLMASITGVGELRPSIGELLRQFEAWMDLDNTLVCRFEDFIGPRGGGSAAAQREALTAVAGHLSIPLDAAAIAHIADGIFSPRSSTFRKGRSGTWREYFGPGHIQTFKELAGDEIIRYGYENDTNW